MKLSSKQNFLEPYLTIFCAFYIGCLSCFLLRTDFACNSLLAASVLNFIVTFVPLPKRLNAKEIQLVFCTGTFAGMSSLEIIPDAWHVLAVSFLGATIFILVKPYFKGIGGKLGAVAFVSAFIWLLLKVAQ